MTLELEHAQRVTCRCDRAIPELDLDGDLRCSRCGRCIDDGSVPPPPPVPVLYLCRQQHQTEAQARAEARRRAPHRRVAAIRKRKVRAGRVVAPQGRPSRDGDLGRPIWEIELAA